MNTIVDKLLDVDKEARKILDDAQQYYERTLLETEEEKAHILRQYTDRANKHMEDARSADAAEAQERIRKIQEKNDALAVEMESTFHEHRQQWCDELFARCVAGR